MEAHSGALAVIGVPVSTQVTKRCLGGAILRVGGLAGAAISGAGRGLAGVVVAYPFVLHMFVGEHPWRRAADRRVNPRLFRNSRIYTIK